MWEAWISVRPGGRVVCGGTRGSMTCARQRTRHTGMDTRAHARGRTGGEERKADLCTLLLGEHLLLLLHDFRVVLEHEGEGEADEEGGGGDDPDEVADNLAGALYEACGLAEAT